MPRGLEKKVMEFIRLHELFAGAERVLLAVSGGADSVALLHVLVSLRSQRLIAAELICAHINHQLRGPQSDSDEQFVIEQAGRLNLPVMTRTANVREYAAAHHLSQETAGRQLRFASLQETASERGCTWVATGHQKNDNAETLIHRLRRGTGFRGLAGIWPARPFGAGLRLARPLLCATRNEIAAYLHKHKLPWRADHTNVDLAYTRNYIRHRLLPALQEESRRPLVEELSALAAAARELYGRIQSQAEEAGSRLARFSEGRIALQASALASLPEPVAIELVRQALVGLGCGERSLTQQHYRAILRLAQRPGNGRRVSLPHGFVARYEQGQVILDVAEAAKAHQRKPAPPESPAGPAPTVLQVPGRTHFAGREISADVRDRREIEQNKVKAGKSGFREYFDLDKISLPVVVRPRQIGDHFWPLGLAGEKKVGKFLTTAKVSRELRERIVIFADREKIIWVCPVRISEQAKVTEETRRILSLRVNREA
jgi:tRNA(Ile)-lysidine synthase